MEEDIQNYSPTVMFRGTPYIHTLKFGLPLVSELPGVLEKNLPLFHHFQNGANPLFEITSIFHFKYNGSTLYSIV